MKIFSDSSISSIKNFIHTFNEKRLEEISKEIGFIKRQREITVGAFFKAFVFGCTSLKSVTLENIIDYMKEVNPSIKITKQGLCDKLAAGEKFMEYIYHNILSEFINNTFSNNVQLSDEIKDVKIFDSTFIELLNKLRPYYKGYTGDASNSGLKLEVLYSLRDRRVINNEVFNAVDSDTDFTTTIVDNVKEKELYIGDLGYFNCDMFKRIDEKQGYFLSKIKSNNALYREDDEGKLIKVTLQELVDESSNGVIDTTLYINSKKANRIKCRFVGKKLTEKQVRKMKSKCKKLKSPLPDWTFLITNADSSILPISKIFMFYRLRWQIEIVFKCWKSYVNLDKIKDKGIHYVHCMLYGNLIGITFMEGIYNDLNKEYQTTIREELSILKFFKAITNKIKEISLNLYNNSTCYRIINEILDRVYKRSTPEKRKRKRTREVALS